MKIILLMTAFFGSFFLKAQEKPFEEAMPNTGNLSPEKRAKLKTQYEKMVQESKEYRANFVPPDYSNKGTKELLETALLYHPFSEALEYPYIKAELKKRPKELKNEIYKQISTPIPELRRGGFLERLLIKIPNIAELVSKDFQIEVAKLCLLKEGYEDMYASLDSIHFPIDNLLKIISASPKDETSFLQTLIEEKRLKRGGVLDKKWRPLLKKPLEKIDKKNTYSDNKQEPIKAGSIRPQIGEDRNNLKETTTNPVTGSKGDAKTFNHPESEEHRTKKVDKGNRLPWIVGGFLMLSIAGFFFIKGKK